MDKNGSIQGHKTPRDMALQKCPRQKRRATRATLIPTCWVPRKTDSEAMPLENYLLSIRLTPILRSPIIRNPPLISQTVKLNGSRVDCNRREPRTMIDPKIPKHVSGHPDL